MLDWQVKYIHNLGLIKVEGIMSEISSISIEYYFAIAVSSPITLFNKSLSNDEIYIFNSPSSILSEC